MSIAIMKILHPYFYLFVLLLLTSCNGRKQFSIDTHSSIQKNSIESQQKINFPEFGFKTAIVDKKGHLWFGSFSGGLYHYDGNSFFQFTEKEGLCSKEVHSILEDKHGVLWIGTSEGLCRYNGESFTHIPLPFQDTSSVWLDEVYPIINPNAVHSMIQDQNGDFWIGTGGGGAYKFDGHQFTPFLRNSGAKYADSLYHNWIPVIKEDSDGNIWFASMSYGGLQKFDGTTFTQYLKKDGLSDDMIRCILEDQSGILWFGFNGNRDSGLTYYDGRNFGNYSVDDGLCFKGINAMCEDHQNRLWLGGMDGICIFDGEEFQKVKNEEMVWNGINFIVEDHDKNIWFGGREGIWKYDGDTFVSLIK